MAQNASVALGLLRRLDIGTLALEWPALLHRWVEHFRSTGLLEPGLLPDEARAMVVAGDGRINAEYLALLRRQEVERVVLIDQGVAAPCEWSDRDAAMADAVLAAVPPLERALVVAGNLHTPLTRRRSGVPMDARLAAARAGVVELLLSYGAGTQ